jgi:hypothetical protein
MQQVLANFSIITLEGGAAAPPDRGAKWFNRMRAVIVFALQCMLAASAFAQDGITLFDMQGTWRGTYTYPGRVHHYYSR